MMGRVLGELDALERGFIAGNRTGKTVAGGYEVSCHLTGQYPSWWPGRRFARLVAAFIAHARTDVPALLARDRERTATLAESAATIQALRDRAEAEATSRAAALPGVVAIVTSTDAGDAKFGVTRSMFSRRNRVSFS